ncbi:MAG: hypothetical protein ACXWL5_05225 [Candidatus Chromulinivorax sp.]
MKNIFMKNHMNNILKDTTFLLFLAMSLGNVFGQWLGCYVWWTAKYGLILFACGTIYHLVKQGNSVLLVTVLISSIVRIVYPFFP